MKKNRSAGVNEKQRAENGGVRALIMPHGKKGVIMALWPQGGNEKKNALRLERKTNVFKTCIF